jgi:hypothetical protein
MCLKAHATDDAFAYVCDCDQWQGVCAVCLTGMEPADAEFRARHALGVGHAVRQRMNPGETPPMFQSLLMRDIRDGKVQLPPQFQQFRDQLAAIPPGYEGMVMLRGSTQQQQPPPPKWYELMGMIGVLVLGYYLWWAVW